MRRKNKEAIEEQIAEQDKIHLEKTSNGKLQCTKCQKEFYTMSEFVKHCSSKRHLKPKRIAKKTIEEYKVLSLIHNEDTVGLSFIIKCDSRPTFRILNGIEQCVEGYNLDHYVVLKCRKYEAVGFRITGVGEIFEELTEESYNQEENQFTLNIYYKIKEIIK